MKKLYRPVSSGVRSVQMKPDPKKKRRTRPPVTITLSTEAVEMSKAICRVEGSTLSRLVERMIRDVFREHGLTLPVEK